MTFNSLQFAGFFAVVLFVYYCLQLTGQNLIVAAARRFDPTFGRPFLAFEQLELGEAQR